MRVNDDSLPPQPSRTMLQVGSDKNTLGLKREPMQISSIVGGLQWNSGSLSNSENLQRKGLFGWPGARTNRCRLTTISKLPLVSLHPSGRLDLCLPLLVGLKGEAGSQVPACRVVARCPVKPVLMDCLPQYPFTHG